MPDERPKVKIPEAITKYIKRDAPKEAKMLAAKATVPMAPMVQVSVLTFLIGDSEAEVAEEAKKSLLNMPGSILKSLLTENLHPKTFDFFVKNRTQEDDLMEQIVLNSSTPDDCFVYLADKTTGKVLDIIGQNQQRMLKTPEIANSFKKNPNASKAAIEKIVSFLRMRGIQVEGESTILNNKEINNIIKQTQAQAEEIATQNPQFSIPAAIQNAHTGFDEKDEDSEDDFYEDDDEVMDEDGGFSDDDLGGDFDLFEDKADASDEEKKSIAAQIEGMSIPHKVKLALLGNKEVRTILIKDSNKIVAGAVIKSPKLTDNEVHSISQMRTVSDEIIRTIANNKDWVKNYTIKLALANNPKCPLPVAMKLMRFLNSKDVGDLSKNKNVSPQLQKMAKQQYNKMRGVG